LESSSSNNNNNNNSSIIGGCRYFSSSKEVPNLDYIQKYYVVHRRGDPGHGSREYLLLPPDATAEDLVDPSLKQAAGALLAHRNVLFGARSFCDDYSLSQVCLPLVEVAMKDAGENGEQPQAIASLAGLSEWVQRCLDDETASDATSSSSSSSHELFRLQTSDDPTAYEAVRSIATGIPRQGHSVVGIGTYRDGEEGWKALAREFVELELCEEANLYQQQGGKLVAIEHMADKNPDYLQTAGGAMARLFFL
jgi:hypothetical protein